jgi:hypothetical protein
MDHFDAVLLRRSQQETEPTLALQDAFVRWDRATREYVMKHNLDLRLLAERNVERRAALLFNPNFGRQPAPMPMFR